MASQRPTAVLAVLLLLCRSMLCVNALHASPNRPASGANYSAYSATGTNYSAYSAICVVARDENRYVREWVEYHLMCLGVGAVHLYDHSSVISMQEQLGGLIASGRVTYDRFEGHHKRFKNGFSSNLDRFSKTAQGYAYRDCLTKYGQSHTFVGFIDIDEFVAIHERQAAGLDDILRDYEAYGGVSFHWRVLGSSGHTSTPNGSVVESYTACLPRHHELNRQIKSFVNTAFQPVMISPHRAAFHIVSGGGLGRHGSEKGPAYISGHHVALQVGGRRHNETSGALTLVNEDFTPLKKGMRNIAVWRRAAVYHYVLKSVEDFQRKAARGGGAGVTRNISHFKKIDKQAVETCLGAVETQARLCTGNHGTQLFTE